MTARWPVAADGALLEQLRAFPRFDPTQVDATTFFSRAEAHGLAGVFHEAWNDRGGALDAALARELDARAVARALDHQAHLEMLRRIDRVLEDARVPAVALKGVLLGERLYSCPSVRPTSDIDLLVEEVALSRAADALEKVGYSTDSGPREERFRREHHHLHLWHQHALPLELHFHAYRGFGRVLPSEPLLARAREVPNHSFAMLRVLEPADELVYLAVHAAAHRFLRLGWLYDLKLLAERMTAGEVAIAVSRARAWGYSKALCFAAVLLRDVLGVDNGQLVALDKLLGLRRPLLWAVVGEPDNPLLRSATRFVYTSTLCDSLPASMRYATQASLGHAKRLLRLED